MSMSMAPSATVWPYDKSQFESVIARFEQAWHVGQRPALAEYLPAEGPLRQALLVELVTIDIEFRTQRGEACNRADYERQFPELLTNLSSDAAWLQATLTHAPDSTPSSVNLAAATPHAIAELFGRYRILKELGQGGMGAVYLAHDTQLDRQVALKVPKFSGEDTPDLIERFYREARAASSLRHSNICPVFDVGQIDGQHYITMAYIEGRTLSALSCVTTPAPQRQAAAVIRKLALAMAEAHGKGVIHRDLKPANIMIDQQGEPVIMDFGLARRSIDVKGETVPGDFGLIPHSLGLPSRSTQKGRLLGTPAYMSPEQLDAPTQVGPASDLYSLGVILYELLTGELPFPGDVMTVLSKIRVEDPLPPSTLRSDLDPVLEAICMKMMARRQQDRFGSMAELAGAVSDYLTFTAGSDTEAALMRRATTLSPPPADGVAMARLSTSPRLTKRRLSFIVAGFAASASLLIATILYVAGGRQKVESPSVNEDGSNEVEPIASSPISPIAPDALNAIENLEDYQARFEDQLNEYLALVADDAVPIGNPYLPGKAIVVEKTPQGGQISEVHLALPPEIRAETPEEVGTIVLIQWKDFLKGPYPNTRQVGYSVQGDMRVIDLAEKKLLAKELFPGGDPPLYAPDDGSHGRGPKPIATIFWYISGLNRGGALAVNAPTAKPAYHLKAIPVPHAGAPAVGASSVTGRMVSVNEVLLRRDAQTGDWQRIAAQEIVLAGQKLLSLPAFRPTISLANGVTLELLGGTSVEFLAVEQEVPVIQLEYGRVVALTPGRPDTRLKVNARGRVVEISFGDAGSVAALEARPVRIEGTDPDGAPPQVLALYVVKGKLTLADPAGQTREVKAPSVVSLGTVPLAASDMPEWIGMDRPSPLEKIGAAFLAESLKLDRPVLLGLKELAEDRRGEVRSLAVKCLARVGDFEPLVAALNQADPNFKNAWNDLILDLRGSIARGPETAADVRRAFERQRGEQAAALYRMLWGYSISDLRANEGKALKQLVADLDHNDMDFRALAFWNLRNITGQTLFYRPEHNAQVRKPYVQKWRQWLESNQLLPAASTPTPP